MTRARDNADLGDSYGALGAGVTGGSGLTALGTVTAGTLEDAVTYRGINQDLATTDSPKFGVPTGGDAGNVIQVVHEFVTGETITSDGSWAPTNLTATIRPTSNTSKILILANPHLVARYDGGSAGKTGAKIYKGSVADSSEYQLYVYDYGNSGPYTNAPFFISHLSSPASSTDVVYTVRIKYYLGTDSRLNAGIGSGITLIEVSA